MHECAGSCSEWNPASADLRDTQGGLPGPLSPTFQGPRSFIWGRCGSTRRLVLCHSPWFLLQPRAVSTNVQKSFPLQGWVPSHYALSWWALPGSIQLSLHHAKLFPLLSSFPFQPWLSLYCPHSHFSHDVPFSVLVPISAMAFPLLSLFRFQWIMDS